MNLNEMTHSMFSFSIISIVWFVSNCLTPSLGRTRILVRG